MKPQTTTLRYHQCTFQKYIARKIGLAPLENGLECETSIAPNTSHRCLKNSVSEFFIRPGLFSALG